MVAPSDPRRLAGRLLRWYEAHARDLPWRRRPDPYRVWISEIMLQQTTVATAGPYFARFVRRYPDIRSLARAREQEVLALWSGLGYYHRARNVLKTARILVERHGGRIPDDPASLLGLPGIGPYTAGAILSIGHGLPHTAVDGNVIRVIARLAVIRGDPALARVKRRVESIVADMMPSGRASTFNQALMDLGATVCTPRAPRCGGCPLAASCRARLEGLTESIPAAGRRARVVPVELTALAVRRGGEVFLVRRKSGSLMGGMWEFPLVPSGDGRDEAAVAARRLGAALTAEAGEVRHTITRHRLSIRVKEARLTAGGRARSGGRPAMSAAEPSSRFATIPGDAPGRWVSLPSLVSGDAGVPLTGVARKIVRLLSSGADARRSGARA